MADFIVYGEANNQQVSLEFEAPNHAQAKQLVRTLDVHVLPPGKTRWFYVKSPPRRVRFDLRTVSALRSRRKTAEGVRYKYPVR